MAEVRNTPSQNEQEGLYRIIKIKPPSSSTPPPPSAQPIEENRETYTPRKRGKQTFEHTHERISLWLDKRLKKQFYALAKKHDLVLTALLDEAIADVLKKYEEHPPD